MSPDLKNFKGVEFDTFIVVDPEDFIRILSETQNEN